MIASILLKKAALRGQDATIRVCLLAEMGYVAAMDAVIRRVAHDIFKSLDNHEAVEILDLGNEEVEADLRQVMRDETTDTLRDLIFDRAFSSCPDEDVARECATEYVEKLRDATGARR